jgi:hypothetical protein
MYLEATARARAGRKARQGTQPQRRKKPAGRFNLEKLGQNLILQSPIKVKTKKCKLKLIWHISLIKPWSFFP